MDMNDLSFWHWLDLHSVGVFCVLLRFRFSLHDFYDIIWDYFGIFTFKHNQIIVSELLACISLDVMFVNTELWNQVT